MRADLERIKKMIDSYLDETQPMTIDENSILRELLTTWQAMSASEYQTDTKLHLNMLTKRMLDPNGD